MIYFVLSNIFDASKAMEFDQLFTLIISHMEKVVYCVHVNIGTSLRLYSSIPQSRVHVWSTGKIIEQVDSLFWNEASTLFLRPSYLLVTQLTDAPLC